MRAARRGGGWMTCDDQVERRRSAVQTRAAPDSTERLKETRSRGSAAAAVRIADGRGS